MTNSGIPGYRETAAGWTPEDWVPLSLGTIASARKSKAVAQQGVRCVELEHIEPETGRLLGWDSSGAQASIKTAFKQGDVLFGKLRPYLRKYAVAPFNGICTTEILAIHPKDDLADGSFLFQLMQGDGVFSTIEALSYGTKMPRVSWSDLADIVVGVPSLAEQRGVAAILTAVDDKLDVIARQIEATQTLKRGLMQTLFTKGVGSKGVDGRWARHAAFVKVGSTEYPKSWRMGRMGDVAPLVRREVDIQLGENYPELGLRSFGKGTFHKPALTAEQVGSKRLFLIKAGDLLLSNVFAWEGAVAVAGPADDGRYGSHRYITCKVDPDITNVHFVARYLVTPAGLASIGIASPGGAGRNKTLGLAALADIQIPLPPLAEQNAINEVLQCIEAKIATLQAKHELYRDLKRGLMQKLLTGEWRVSVDADMAA